MNKLTVAIEFNSKRFYLQFQWSIGQMIQRGVNEIMNSMAMGLTGAAA